MVIKKKLVFLIGTFTAALFLALACTSDEEAIESPINATDSFEVTAPPERDVSDSFEPIYFDFDRSAVKNEFNSHIMNVANT